MKIGNITIITYPLSKCNLKAPCPKAIYLINKEISFCPFCGTKKLIQKYCFGFQINNTECAKIYGNYCEKCCTLFSDSHFPIDWYQSKKKYSADKTLPEVKKMPDSELKSLQSDYFSSMPTTQSEKQLQFCSNTTLYIYRGNIKCFERHDASEVKVLIKGLNEKSNGFFATYCHTCQQFLMKYTDYENYLARFKLFPSKVSWYDRPYGWDCFERAEKSPLSLLGYSVNCTDDVSDVTRQGKLAFIMDHGLLEKRKILDYLEQFIQINGKVAHNANACLKWQKDKDFVLNYSAREVPIVNIGTVLPR